ncbi:MAG: hypothetical protein ACI9LM_000263 [Alteromonadaceae bacterium]|jgi:hypothetical protein
MIKKSTLAPYFMMLIIIFTASKANAGIINLVENGSFEDLGTSVALGGYGSRSTWQIYSSISDWQASQNVEIWSNNFIVPAYDGNRVLELNAHRGNVNGKFSIYQSLVTNIGQTYELTFAGRRRQANSDESFSVSIGGLFDSVHNQTSGQWNEYRYQFTALSALSTLTFTSLDGGRDATGNVFDDIRVTAVPEPSTLAIFALGMIGLASRRFNKKS